MEKRYTAAELKKALDTVSKEDLIKTITKLYTHNHDVQLNINLLLNQDNFADTKWEETKKIIDSPYGSRYAGTAKAALAEYTKVCKDSEKRLMAYLYFGEKVMEFYTAEKVDFKAVMTASAQFGKACQILEKHPELWDNYESRAYDLANSMYQTGLEAGYNAGMYYHDAKTAVSQHLGQNQ